MSLISEIKKDLINPFKEDFKYKLISQYIDKYGLDEFINHIYEVNFKHLFFKKFDMKLIDFLSDDFIYEIQTPNGLISIPKIQKIIENFEIIEFGHDYIYLDPIDYTWNIFYQKNHYKILKIKKKE